uniref:CDP-diacylglycerol--glycerol-3-phosphate 3-phosphatidyltransferase n=1 Tax=Aegilops tauschii subsp. strangulata TaxID=200361 RepID=A0A453IC35_AEGTS
PARGLCSSPHSGPAEGMGSDGTGARRRLPPANGVSKEGAPLPLPQPVPPRLLTLPTVLTIGRVAAVPFLISTFYMEGPWAATATTGIFLAAAITDWLDGYIARKMHLGTPFGAFLDPVADKVSFSFCCSDPSSQCCIRAYLSVDCQFPKCDLLSRTNFVAAILYCSLW